MDYKVEDIEDQIIATLEGSTELAGVDARTHAGQINIQMFLDPQYVEGLIPSLPFVYVRYKGRTTKNPTPESVGLTNRHELQFECYVAASSLRATEESQRSCYSMLRGVYDALHGAWPNAVSVVPPPQSPKLAGSQITDVLFYPLSPLLEVGGQDEKLVIQLPRIAVYSTSYKILMRT